MRVFFFLILFIIFIGSGALLVTKHSLQAISERALVKKPQPSPHTIIDNSLVNKLASTEAALVNEYDDPISGEHVQEFKDKENISYRVSTKTHKLVYYNAIGSSRVIDANKKKITSSASTKIAADFGSEYLLDFDSFTKEASMSTQFDTSTSWYSVNWLGKKNDATSKKMPFHIIIVTDMFGNVITAQEEFLEQK